MVTRPTRYENILDLFLIDNPTLVKSVEIKPGIADHDAVLSEVFIKPQINKLKPRLISMYSKADWEGLENHILSFQESFLVSCEGFMKITEADIEFGFEAAYTLQYVDGMKPPSTPPADPLDRVFSVAINSVTSRPLKAIVLDSSNDPVESGDFADVLQYEIETLDVNAVGNPSYSDAWLNSGGHLAIWGRQAPFPGRMQKKYFTYITEGSNKIRNFTIDRGMLAVDGLVHKHPDGDKPPNNRVYRMTLFLSDGSSIYKDSSPIQITDEARTIVNTTVIPTVLEAGEPFSIGFEILDKNGARLTDGTDSVLLGELQVAWENTTIITNTKVNKEDILFQELVRLRGPNVQRKKAQMTYVQRVQFSAGVATFTDMEILDVHPSLRINVTMFLPWFPWTRRPDSYTDFASKVVYPWGGPQGDTVMFMNVSYPQDPAVFLTEPIEITAQTATQLVVTTKDNVKPVHNANFPIEGQVEIEIQDSNGKRVYSGPDSTLNIIPSISPSGNCLSADATITAVDGKGIFTGSVCSPCTGVNLIFDAESVNSGSALTSDQIGPLTFNNEIHMAGFHATHWSGTGQNIGGHLDAMARFAMNDINAVDTTLPGRQLVMHTYDTAYHIPTTIRQYKIMKAMGEADPSQKQRVIIGFGLNTITQAMQPLLTEDQVPQLATREDMNDFGDKGVFPYFNRICWDMGAASHSIMLAAKSRTWMTGVVMRCRDVEVDGVFYEKAKQFGIDLTEVTLPVLSLEQYATIGILAEEIQKMKSLGSKIVWLYCKAPLLWKVVHELYMADASPHHGFQWVTVSFFTWMMPYGNGITLCQGDPLCSVMSAGNQGFGPTYNISGLQTPLWESALENHFKRDLMYYHGTVQKHTLNIATSEFGLGYDAVLLIAAAFDSLVSQNLTITGPSLATAIRNVEVDALTGTIALDPDTGNRPGYFGYLCALDPWDPVLGAQISSSGVISRYLAMENTDATDQMEYITEVQWPLNTDMIPNYNAPINPYRIANTTWTNRRRFNSSDGMFTTYQKIVPIPPSVGPVNLKVELEEDTVAAFYCEAGCGGGMIDVYNISRYAQGDCVTMNKCLCHDGFYGPTCANMICTCQHGYCNIPRTCICEAGWVGNDCESAVCSTPCVNGECTSPDVCTCDSGYVGGDCSQQLVVLIVVPVLIVIVVIVGLVFFLRWFLKRQALKAALSNLDWRCNWEEEVQTGVGAVSMVSTAGEEIMTKKNYISWKSQRCFAQKYDCDTLDVNDEGLRMEVVHMKELRHNNLITFVGACLEWPNVCILTEICPKGSLEDLLANETVRLGWDFKYSLLKDICRGMDFLHRSLLGSHGRLKSTNCLVDNRWTCKIAGFGLPTIRYAGSRKEIPGKEEEEQNPLKGLFWTPPELLTNTTNINDVGKGTPAGDAYSFSIIMTEVISREEPYSSEVVNLTAEEIIQLVRDKNAPSAAKAKRRWYESGGDTTKLFRPKIDDSFLPEEYNAKLGMRKLLEQNWSESSENRLTFRQNLDRLNEIHPIKGELIDNLVNMLEKYSSNLESIVAERTKELMVEKAKTEQLVSQMLPKKVVEDLKHGRPVEPESFECVTIFFSDLVGFTAIAKESTPLQVVDLLNDLYTTFDAILDNYDVYKVETIGDAYMVVSGLPIRNGDLHAGEIASVSLDLLSSMTDFKIRHLPGQILQLRIGMHSGPCVAGVVGLKMPRYCLFGDTVNTASRMESSSMALRIHMSEHTANILFRLGGYHLDCRGEREVKGKGKMTTYWLEGKDGFDKPLPGRELAVSESKHEFK